MSRVSESLDYEPVQNQTYFERIRQRKAKRHVYGYSGLTLAKLIVVMLTGLITGLLALFISKGSMLLMRYRNSVTQQLIDRAGGELGRAFTFNVAFGVSLASVAGCMVTFWAPSAAGAGVSLVMAYLNGNHIPNLLRFRTLVTKVVGTLLGVSSGLAIGPEGPLVHIGACVASNVANANCHELAKLFMPCWSCDGIDGVERGASDEEEGSTAGDDLEAGNPCSVWEELHEDSEHREFISAGAAAGLSAAFGAPIGGVLFSMEEACSFWSRKVAWRCFIAAILAAFTISQLAAHDTPILFNNVRTLDHIDEIRQVPFMVLVSLVGGLLGAAFNSMRVYLWRFRASRSRPFLRLAELVAITILCICAIFAASKHLGRCRAVPTTWPAGFKGVRFNCPAGQHNDIATVMMDIPDDILSCLFSVGSDRERHIFESGFSPGSLLIFGAVYIAMMALCAGTCIPAGLFMPCIMLGATAGLAIGTWLQATLPADWHIQPGLYALIGATAVLAGVFRSAISVVVIVVEGTRGIDFLFAVIIAVVTANWVADLIHQDGVYESELERDGNVYFLRHEPPHALSTLTAEQIMVRDPISFPPLAAVKDVLDVLTSTTHHGFPVVAELRPADSTEEGVGQLEGIILRSQLLVMLRERAFCSVKGVPLTPVTRRTSERLERDMRMFYRRSYTHHRHMAVSDTGMRSLYAALSRPEALTHSFRALNGAAAAAALSTLSEEEPFEPSSARTSEPVTSSEQPGMDDGLDSPSHFSDVAPLLMRTSAPVPCAELVGSRNLDETEELRRILDGMGCGSLLYLDLRMYMNTAPLTVRKEMSAARVHRTFVTLGMRHLCVTNHKNRIVGIVTRKDLDAAAGRGAWRRAAPTQAQAAVSRTPNNVC